jgi:hypothetical protein
LDDILIFSIDEKKHINHLKTILSILKDNNLSINLEKSQFFKNQILFLGHVIDENGLRPDITVIPELTTLIPAKTKKQVQRLCGFINWFRPYIKNLSLRVKIITDLLYNKRMIKWTSEHTKIVEDLFIEIKKIKPL